MTVMDLVAQLQALPPEFHTAPVLYADGEYGNTLVEEVRLGRYRHSVETFMDVPRLGGGTTAVYTGMAQQDVPAVILG